MAHITIEHSKTDARKLWNLAKKQCFKLYRHT